MAKRSTKKDESYMGPEMMHDKAQMEPMHRHMHKMKEMDNGGTKMTGKMKKVP